MDCSSLYLIRRCLMWFWMRISWKMHVNTWRSTWRFTGVLHISPVLPLLTPYWSKAWSLHPQPTLANRLYQSNGWLSSSVIIILVTNFPPFHPFAVLWNSRADRMITLTDIGEPICDLFGLFSSGFWVFLWIWWNLPSSPAGAACAAAWDQTGRS